MQDDLVFVGADVAKADLAIAIWPTTKQLTLGNDRASISRWLRTLRPGSLVAMESTGRYHQLLAQLAIQAGMRVYILNARDVYFYAKALGVRGKSDASDALVIARYLAQHHPQLHAWMPGTAAQQRLQEMLRRRAVIERHLSAIDDSLDGVADLAQQRTALASYAGNLLAEVEQKIQALIACDIEMRQRQQQLQTITGVGPLISAVLVALLSRIEFANVGALIAYSGLDPRPNDSGSRRGRRALTKRGPASLRKMMWLAAFSASHSKAFAAHYQGIKARGFSGTEALVILARKLLRIAWAVWKTGQPFDPSKVLKTA